MQAKKGSRVILKTKRMTTARKPRMLQAQGTLVQHLERALNVSLPPEFFSENYGRRHCLLPAAAPCRSLFGWDDLNQLLRSHRLYPPRIRLAHSRPEALTGVNLHAWTVSRSPVATSWLRTEQLQKALAGGGTLVIDGVEEISDALRELAIELESLLRDRVRMNCYASFGSDQGFGVHWDDHDVFALQLAGCKKWSLYGYSRAAPLALDVEATDLPPPEPIDEIEIHPGDVLYVPRGSWHTVFGLGEPSLHLAIGVTKRKGVDFLSWLIDRMRDDPAVRSDIPRFEGERNALAYEERLKSTVADLLAQEDLLGQFLREQDEDATPALVTNLPWVISADGLAGDDPTVIWRGTRARFDVTDEGQLVVHSAGKEFEFSEAVRPLIERIVDRPARVSELQAAVPAVAQVVPKLVRELARAGLIELVIQPTACDPSQSGWSQSS